MNFLFAFKSFPEASLAQESVRNEIVRQEASDSDLNVQHGRACNPTLVSSSSCSNGLGCYGVGDYIGVFYCSNSIYASRCCCSSPYVSSSNCGSKCGCYGVGQYSGVFYCRSSVYASRCF